MKRGVIFLLIVFLSLMNKAALGETVKVKSVKPIAVGIAKAYWPWSPDSQWICYSNTDYYKDELNLENPPETPGVYVIRYDGTDKRLLDINGKRPSFGRFQYKIVYSKDGASGKKGIKGGLEEDIWMIDFDGGNKIQLTKGPEDTRMKIWGTTCLTYDGKQVLYYFLDVEGTGIVNADGTNPRVLIRNSSVAGFSPDGKKVFITQENVEKEGVLSGGFMSLADGSKEWLIRQKYPENDYWHLAMNLQGTMVTYDNPRWENRNIWVAKLDGSEEAHPITHYKGKAFEKGVTFANHPRFSPDGKWIVYDEQTYIDKGAKSKVVVIKVDGTCKTEVAGALVPEHCGFGEPAWSPDGKKIMYYAPDPNNDNKPSVFVIELEINNE
jgi:Tol biopolymer transport system component